MGPRERRLPVGAEISGDGVHFRVWAPKHGRVRVALEDGPGAGRDVELDPEPDGWFSGWVGGAGAGTAYRYVLGDDPTRLPDPASRWQPRGPHGPSVVVDPTRFRWSDGGWKGCTIAGRVVYEMHIGTYTSEGTWAAAAARLDALRDLGVSLVEVMPVAEFSGRFGWGYDGVDWFAPYHEYGTPDDMRAFVDRAHALGIGVILDVVWNHCGPDGCYLARYGDAWFTRKYAGEWGDPINFDGDDAGPVREFVAANAACWIDEFHLDGLRIDATQAMFDSSDEHIVAVVVRRAREAARGRDIVLIGENEPQRAYIAKPPAEGGFGLDALWNDDLHHSAIAALTGRNHAYYSDTLGRPQELVSAAKWGYLYQGQLYAWQNKRRGTPTMGLPGATFVNYLQNHDQIANSANGRRVHEQTSPGRLRAMTAYLLLIPGTPMLFQGQEFAASAPFLYFADHHADLAEAVRKGRREFLSQFPGLRDPAMAARLATPHDPATFARCRLDHGERERNAHVWRLHRDLIALRRDDPTFASQRADRLHGAVLGDACFALRFFGDTPDDDRLLVVNLGLDLHLRHVPEPLLAPPADRGWAVRWSSEHPDYGGDGGVEAEQEDGWHLVGHAAVVLAPRRFPDAP